MLTMLWDFYGQLILQDCSSACYFIFVFYLNIEWSIMEWSNEKLLTLIELYHSLPILWDCKLKDYKDRNKRHDAFIEIAVRFGAEKKKLKEN